MTTAQANKSPPVSHSLGRTTARGFAWLMGQTVGSKLVSLASQVILARLLLRDDYGLVGLAYTVLAFTTIIQQAGFREILIQRQQRFRRWANAAFWMSLSLGLAAAALTTAIAPIAAHFYHDRRLIGLILVLALSMPLGSLSTVPTARLQVDLRFRMLAVINFLDATSTMILSVVFAWLEFGAYSFVIPRVIVSAFRAMGMWWVAGTPLRSNPQIRRWKFLGGDSALVTGALVCAAIISQGDYATLGFWHSADVVGIYYFAFNLSTQAFALFAFNLWGVLMPALSKMQDDKSRQLAALLRACRLLAMVGVPFGLLQAAVAAPLIRVFFGPRWYPSIPVLQALSIGLTFMMIGSAAVTMFQAQGRFKELFLLSAAFAVAFLALVVTGATVGAALAVAVAVAIYNTFYGPLNLYFAIRPMGGTWLDVWRTYRILLGPGMISMAAAYLLGLLVPHVRGRDIIQLLLVAASGLGLYVLLLRQMERTTWDDARRRLEELLRPARFQEPSTSTAEADPSAAAALRL